MNDTQDNITATPDDFTDSDTNRDFAVDTEPEKPEFHSADHIKRGDIVFFATKSARIVEGVVESQVVSNKCETWLVAHGGAHYEIPAKNLYSDIKSCFMDAVAAETSRSMKYLTDLAENFVSPVCIATSNEFVSRYHPGNKVYYLEPDDKTVASCGIVVDVYSGCEHLRDVAKNDARNYYKIQNIDLLYDVVLPETEVFFTKGECLLYGLKQYFIEHCASMLNLTLGMKSERESK